jgi:DNA-binding winged helix-turn-helix (wHTH) protein/TolB-like protein
MLRTRDPLPVGAGHAAFSRMNDMQDLLRVDLAREQDFALGGAMVQPSSREIVFDGARETVEPRVMQVLVALARRHGEVVSRDALIQQCWEGRIVGEDAINRCLAKVRRLTERMQGVTLETIPRVGYRLTEMAGADPRIPRRLGKRAALVAIGLALVLALLGVLGFSMTQRASPPTFAVLPFTSLNPGEEMHLFGKSIGAATAAALNRAGMPLASTAPLPARAENNPADVGRALGADYVVSGSVRQEGDVVRAIARVDRVDSRITVYSRVFETPASEMRRLPDLVAAEMAQAIASRIVTAAGTSDPTRLRAPRRMLGDRDPGGVEVSARPRRRVVPA